MPPYRVGLGLYTLHFFHMTIVMLIIYLFLNNITNNVINNCINFIILSLLNIHFKVLITMITVIYI
jgi:hypothetical protein